MAPRSCVPIQLGLVASVELVGDGVEWMAAQNARLLFLVKPDHLEGVLVDEDLDGNALLGVE